MGRGHLFLGSPRISYRDREVWALNVGAMTGGLCHVAFQIHQLEDFAGPHTSKQMAKKYDEWLRNLTIPVYMEKHRDEYPTSIAYPFEEVFKMTERVIQGLASLKPLKFLTSSADYAIALAILQNRPKIDLFGFEMAVGTEYAYQRPGLSFWVGFAAGRGIPLNVYCANGIFNKTIYGSERLQYANV